MGRSRLKSVHWSFWLIAVVLLLWNAMGVMNYLVQTMNPEAVAKMPESHRALIEQRPAWATGAFALAVFGGVLGCLLLLFRLRIAIVFFWLSLACVIIQMVPTLQMATSGQFTLFELIMTLAMPLVIAMFLVWFTKRAIRRQQLR